MYEKRLFVEPLVPNLRWVTTCSVTVAREPTYAEKIAGALKEFLVPVEPPKPKWNLQLRMMREVDISPPYYGLGLPMGSDDEDFDD